MARIAYDDLLVCQDCALIIASGDDSGVQDPTTHLGRMTEHMAEYGEGQWVITCDGEGDHDDFSRQPCDACGTTLAGDRCLAAILVDDPALQGTLWHDDPRNWETFGDLPDDHGTLGF